MTKEYSLNLKRNAIDSLQESIKYYQLGVADETKYKFCIILYFHFVELLLKRCVELANPLLCFERPYAEKIDTSKSITWEQAINILNNLKQRFDPNLRMKIVLLAKTRNSIIHYSFNYQTNEIRSLIAETLSGLSLYYDEASGDCLLNEVDKLTKQLLEEIQTDNAREVHLAQAEASEKASDNECEIEDCEICGESRTAVNVNGDIHCYFCKETDTLEECGRCTTSMRRSEMEFFGETEDGNTIFMCDSCLSWMDSQ